MTVHAFLRFISILALENISLFKDERTFMTAYAFSWFLPIPVLQHMNPFDFMENNSLEEKSNFFKRRVSDTVKWKLGKPKMDGSCL